MSYQDCYDKMVVLLNDLQIAVEQEKNGIEPNLSIKETQEKIELVKLSLNKKKEEIKLEQYQCPDCYQKNSSERSLERHNWTFHPKNEYEKAWSRHERNGWQNYSGSSYYQDNPYY